MTISEKKAFVKTLTTDQLLVCARYVNHWPDNGIELYKNSSFYYPISVEVGSEDTQDQDDLYSDLFED